MDHSATSRNTGSKMVQLVPFNAARAQVGISRSTIYRLLIDDAFPRPVKIGRSNYFSSVELQQWIEAQLQSRNGGLVP